MLLTGGFSYLYHGGPYFFACREAVFDPNGHFSSDTLCLGHRCADLHLK